jgi:predicted TIM-barrel fold metal-dependent hydrolase
MVQMKPGTSYLGFPELPPDDDIIHALIHDPPDVRWRWVRALLRIEDAPRLTQFRNRFQEQVEKIKAPLHWKIIFRLQMVMQSIQRPVRVNGYAVVKGEGAFTTDELAAAEYDPSRLGTAETESDDWPAVDFHVHPKMPDLKFLSDMRKAGVRHAVILATDTDSEDLDRPEIVEKLKSAYAESAHSPSTPFAEFLETIRADLYSRTHVTDQDVADWVADYPNTLTGFGSVNLGKTRDYVERKLDRIQQLGLKGIKLLPYSQFFNPAENGNIDTLFEYCRKTGSIVLTHSGCAAGAFEIPELSRDSHPSLWESVALKYPDVPIVLAHFASYSTHQPGIWFSDALALMKKCSNVFADISAAHYLLADAGTVEQIRQTTGFDQVLFATDYPGPLYYGTSLAQLVNNVKGNRLLSETEQRAILVDNGQRLLGLA